MKSAVDDLVSMRDTESLLEIMNENEDWLDRMDAAEGLVALGDRRGLEYLLIAKESDIDDLQQTAIEILADTKVKQMREQIEAEQRFASQKLVKSARERLKKGKKVFLYKVIQLSAADFLQEDAPEGELQIHDLDDAGLEGWEVVNVLAHRQMVGPRNESNSGVYVFLRKELGPEDSAELEKN